MTLAEAMRELESLGTDQNRKIYRRHGVGENQFGVSYANLNQLKKRIKKDHELALQLWGTGNHDARILATMIADPARMTGETLDQWARELENYAQSGAVAGVAAKAPSAREKMVSWIESDDEYVGQLGWNILGQLAMHDASLPDDYFSGYLDTIEARIHGGKNYTRYAMNGALIGIGVRSAALQEKALAAAARIGKVHVDHGETGCKTPDAADYIRKMAARKR